MTAYVLARTGKRRATLQHALVENKFDLTVCGRDISTWSRAYQKRAIPEVLCVVCARRLRGDPALPR